VPVDLDSETIVSCGFCGELFFLEDGKNHLIAEPTYFECHFNGVLEMDQISINGQDFRRLDKFSSILANKERNLPLQTFPTHITMELADCGVLWAENQEDYWVSAIYADLGLVLYVIGDDKFSQRVIEAATISAEVRELIRLKFEKINSMFDSGMGYYSSAQFKAQALKKIFTTFC